MGMPGCPELAFWTASIAKARMALAMSFSTGDWYLGAAAFMAGAEVSWLLKTVSLGINIVSGLTGRSIGVSTRLDLSFYRLKDIDTLKFLT
jgi:hypothetical protein